MNAVVITETRNIQSIHNVIEDHLSMLPDDFELVIFHDQNKHLFKGFNCAKHQVKVNTLREYNNLMTSGYYWSKLKDYNRVLVFQNDSRILREGIEDFYQYDYVGAPWIFQDKGGNGGLSLRNPKAMINTISKTPYNHSLGYEDVYFSNHLVGKLAPREVCKLFSCETLFEMGTWGCHAIENWMKKEDVELILNQYEKINC